MTGPAVRVERDAADPAVAVITLNRPERRNALTVELKEALVAAVAEVAADAAVRAVVLAGSGKAFCVGQDLAEHAAGAAAPSGAAFDTVERHYNPVVRGLADDAQAGRRGDQRRLRGRGAGLRAGLRPAGRRGRGERSRPRSRRSG